MDLTLTAFSVVVVIVGARVGHLAVEHWDVHVHDAVPNLRPYLLALLALLLFVPARPLFAAHLRRRALGREADHRAWRRFVAAVFCSGLAVSASTYWAAFWNDFTVF